MEERYLPELFGLQGQVAVVTGGTGVLGGAMARALAGAGAAVAVLGRRRARAEEAAAEILRRGGRAMPLAADVLNREDLERARDKVLAGWGRIDILVNAAGGNVREATASATVSFLDLPEDALRSVIELNLLGTILPCQVFGAAMAQAGRGSIVTISSMAADRALTYVGAYGAAKAGVEGLTRWLAMDLASRYGEGLRVNAIAPGFFIGEQNRALLVTPDGSLTERGKKIIGHTPAGRFGRPEDLAACLLWLCGPGAAYVTGVVVPVDGGFSATSGI